MTKIEILKNNGLIIAYVISGHTGKAFFGQDILCSAISALAQATVVGVRDIVGLKPKVQIRDGFLSLRLNKKDYENKEAQIILRTMEKSFEIMIKGEEKFVTMEVKDEVV